MGDGLRLDGEVVIVTGAGGGLGRSHAMEVGAAARKLDLLARLS